MAVIGGQKPGQMGILLSASDVIALAGFYANVLDAEEVLRYRLNDGATACAISLRIAGTLFTVAPRMQDTQPSPGAIFSVYVRDADNVLDHALSSGASLVRMEAGTSEAHPVTDLLTGDRVGRFADPAGHTWEIRTRREDVSLNEVQERLKARRALRQNAC